MAVNLSPYGGVGAQFLDNAGNVLTGGKIFTYAAGTTTPQVTYTDSFGTTPHPNPIILDAAGRVPGGEIWLTDGLVYKFVLKDSNDVLIATYDGVSGINSNFVAFTNKQEIQTATAGQTVFNLTTMSYAPGTNSLSVFVDGVNQYGPGAQYAYLETDSDTVTFVNGLHVGAEVKFTTSQLNSSVSTTDAFQVSYVPPFTGSTATNVGVKLSEIVSVADFGAVGDGVTDDTVAIQAAIAVQKPLLWVGLAGNNFKITSSVTQNINTDLIWNGEGATITYTGSHVEYAIRLNDTTGVSFLINDLTIDGSKLCNKPLEVLNNTSNTTASSFTANNLFLTRAKRINTFNGGDGILIRGAFSQVTFNGGGASDCELPAGQGTPGTVGIAGLTVTWYSTTSYPKRMVVNNISINKIYSSDLAYQDDQDGIRYFVPDDVSGISKVPSEFISNNGSSFVNCYGRSIKTQCQNTIVQNSYFERTEGLTSGSGNGEASAQTGSLVFENNVSVYNNGFEPSSVCGSSSDSQYGRPGLTANNNLVYLDSATTLYQFASIFPRAGFFSNHVISGNKIFGKVDQFFAFLCNGDKNFAEVSNNYVGEIVDGVTSEKALVYVFSSGATTPRFANIIAYGNVYDNTHLPALVRDSIPGNAMFSSISAWNNYGFLTDDITKSLDSGGLQTNVAARLGKIASETGRAYFKVLSVTVASGATATVPIQNSSRPIIVFINAQFNNTAYGIFVNSNTSNTVIAKGAAFEFGNTTNPATGTFRVWTSAANEISIENTNASSRTFSIFIMST